jgi:hypothetical protein
MLLQLSHKLWVVQFRALLDIDHNKVNKSLLDHLCKRGMEAEVLKVFVSYRFLADFGLFLPQAQEALF